MWKFEHEVEVRFCDCDPLGHVNNAVYLSYLEAARFSWWRRVFGPDAFTAHGFIIARIEIDYRKPALPADRLIVRLKIDAIGSSSFTIKYEIANTRTRELIAEAKSVQVAYDYAAARSIPISADLRARLEGAL
jgi:acyl-CoA thioester hydrolase